MEYIKRYVDEELKDILECMGAVLIVDFGGAIFNKEVKININDSVF